MSILVITPATGSPELAKAITSVREQNIEVQHLVVVDGRSFFERVNKVEEIAAVDYRDGKYLRCDLPFNTGGNGFYGHRIMAAFGHLINHDYVLFLDQDNWYDPNHVRSLVETIENKKVDWAYSLRKIVDKNGKYACNDDCESLGSWPTWVDSSIHLVDTSTYCFKTSFFKQVCHLWDYSWGADRRFFNILKNNNIGKFACTGKYTLNYRLGGNEGSVTADFFKQGNRVMNQKYNGTLPWTSDEV
jgi:hypothetical protein